MQFGGKSTVTIRDERTKAMKAYRSGDRLAGGVIVMVDNRRMRHPKKPTVFSTGRLLLKFGTHYWAVELGDRLSAGRYMTGGDLPKPLQK